MALNIDPWDPQVETKEITNYSRAWRVELFSDYSADPSFCAHMEQVVIDGDENLLGRKPLPEVRRSLSAVISDPDVQAFMAAQVALLKKWWMEDEANRANAANTETPTL